MFKKLLAGIAALALCVGCAGLQGLPTVNYNGGGCETPTLYLVDKDNKVTIDPNSVQDYPLLQPEVVLGEDEFGTTNLVFATVDGAKAVVALALDYENQDCVPDVCFYYVVQNIDEFKGMTDPELVQVVYFGYEDCETLESFYKDQLGE
jgi:hypothetical protein